MKYYSSDVTVGKNWKVLVTRKNFNFDIIYLRERREFYIYTIVAILLGSTIAIHENISKHNNFYYFATFNYYAVEAARSLLVIDQSFILISTALATKVLIIVLNYLVIEILG